MKVLKVILCISILFQTIQFTYSQIKTTPLDSTIVRGRLYSSKPDSINANNCYLMVALFEYGKPWETHQIEVDDLGNFEHKFPQRAKLMIRTFCRYYFPLDTTLYTETENELVLNLELFHKEIYTYERAVEDIKNGLIQIIMDDTLLYGFNQRYQYTKKYGFDYKLDTEPIFIGNYNRAMEDYLFERDSTWLKNILFIEDSLIHLEADNYGKSHIIDLESLRIPYNEGRPGWLEIPFFAEEKLKTQYNLDIDKLNKYKLEFILSKIDNDQDYKYILLTEYMAIEHYRELIPALIKRLSLKKEIGLRNTFDLYIPERAKAGDISFNENDEFYGDYVNDDLFTVAGRANYILKSITYKNFGNVSMYSTEKDLKKLQNRWAYWLLKLNEKR